MLKPSILQQKAIAAADQLRYLVQTALSRAIELVTRRRNEYATSRRDLMVYRLPQSYCTTPPSLSWFIALLLLFALSLLLSPPGTQDVFESAAFAALQNLQFLRVKATCSYLLHKVTTLSVMVTLPLGRHLFP